MPLSPPSFDEWTAGETSGGYGTRDTNRLDPTRLSTPLAETVLLGIDERVAGMAPAFEGIHHLDTVVARLAIGDLLATHGDRALVIILTTAAELAAAMDDDRLKRQVRDISRHRLPTCLIVEGGLYSSRAQPLPRFAALQTRLMLGMRIPIIETIDRRHTAYAAVTAIRDHFFDVAPKFAPDPHRLPDAGPIDTAKLMLETVHGISPGRAAALLEKFGSIAAICRASVKRITAVDGIGTTTATRLHAALREAAPGRD